MGRKKAAVPETMTPSNNVHPQAASMDIYKGKGVLLTIDSCNTVYGQQKMKI
jgi:hypothetical protein